jgi:hypothetical protein
VKESWTKLFVIGPLLNIRDVIGAENTGDLFFETKDGQLLYFDLSSQKTEEFGVKGNETRKDEAVFKGVITLAENVKGFTFDGYNQFLYGL